MQLNQADSLPGILLYFPFQDIEPMEYLTQFQKWYFLSVILIIGFEQILEFFMILFIDKSPTKIDWIIKIGLFFQVWYVLCQLDNIREERLAPFFVGKIKVGNERTYLFFSVHKFCDWNHFGMSQNWGRIEAQQWCLSQISGKCKRHYKMCWAYLSSEWSSL